MEFFRLLAAALLYPGLLLTVGLGWLADRAGQRLRTRPPPKRRAARSGATVDLRLELIAAVASFSLAAALLPLPGSPAPVAYANLGGVIGLILTGLWLRGLEGAGTGAAALAWATALTSVAEGAGTLDLTALRVSGRPLQVAVQLSAALVVLACTVLLISGSPALRARRRSFDLSGLVDQLHAAANWGAWGALALVFATVFTPAARPRPLAAVLAVGAFVGIGALSAAARRLSGRFRQRLARAVLLPLSLILVLLALIR